jgi:hypothetical protein
MTGALRVDIDEAAGTWTAEGQPVIVTRGRVVLRAPRIRYDLRARVVTASGGIQVTEAGLTVSGDAAEIRLADDWLRVSGDVRVVNAREDPPAELRASELEAALRTRRLSATGGVSLVRGAAALTGQRLDYDDATRVAIVTGEPVARFMRATLTAGSIALLLEPEILRGEGAAQIRRGDLAGGARRIDVRSREGHLRHMGEAVLVRGRDRLTAGEIDAALDGSRIVARGSARVVVTPP